MTKLEQEIELEQALERGAASLKIAVSKGQLTVTHGQDRSVLLSGPLPIGGWQTIITALLEAAPEADGPMRRAK